MTIFANHYEGSDDTSQHNSLASDNAIQLESREANVTIKAGSSIIVVDSSGAITISNDDDITFTSNGKFTVNANGIELRSAGELTAEGLAGAELTSGANTVIKGSIVKLN